MWQVLAAAALVAATLAGCDDDVGGPATESQLERMRAAVDDLPAAYTYDLSQRCGENSVSGEYRVWVVDGAVARATALDGRPQSMITPENLPTLADLVEQVDDAGPDAEIELRLGADDLPRGVAIDHDPDAIDDEVCYQVSNVT